MHVLDTYKFKFDDINSNREKVATKILRRSRAPNSVVRGQIWSNVELIQALMYVFVTCKYAKDQMEKSRENVMTSFSLLKVYGIFFKCSRAANSKIRGQILPNFELIRALMYFAITCKYEKDLIKNRRRNAVTPFSPL